MDRNLSTKQVQRWHPCSNATRLRHAKDKKSDFPKPFKVGRSVYWKESEILEYLSKKTGFKVDPQDKTITAKELLETFGKSHTWLWANIKSDIESKGGNIPKPFYINRTRFWMQSQIDALTSTSEG